MSKLGLLKSLWLTRFSRPAGERVLFRHVLRNPPKRILEIGLGMLVRTERLLEATAAGRTAAEIHYVGIDRFEGRGPSDPPGVTLKQAHQRLHGRARVQLVPGNVDTALSRVCNHLGVFDMVVISNANDERHLAHSWFFLQRITAPHTTAFVEAAGPAGRTTWSVLSKSRIDELAARAVLQKAG
jgi:hypothetical protein